MRASNQPGTTMYDLYLHQGKQDQIREQRKFIILYSVVIAPTYVWCACHFCCGLYYFTIIMSPNTVPSAPPSGSYTLY